MDLTALIDQYRAPLIGLIASWGAPWSDAADIAQDSFAEAYLNRESCRGDWRQSEVFGRWLRGVARNRWRDWARGRHRRARVLSLDEPGADQLSAPELAEPTERIQELRRAIERLSSAHRQVILMRYLEGTRVADIAALLSVSVKTVEGRLYQARLSLGRMLERSAAPSDIGKVMLWL